MCHYLHGILNQGESLFIETFNRAKAPSKLHEEYINKSFLIGFDILNLAIKEMLQGKDLLVEVFVEAPIKIAQIFVCSGGH